MTQYCTVKDRFGSMSMCTAIRKSFTFSASASVQKHSLTVNLENLSTTLNCLSGGANSVY